jgi:hypothetical protein
MNALIEALTRAVANPAARIGTGGGSFVHAIQGFPQYVARFPKSRQIIGDVLEHVDDPFEGRNFGNAVYRSGDVTINKRQLGVPAGMTYPGHVSNPDSVYRDMVGMAADMPQQAYNQFADDLKFVNDRGHQFDPSKSNNVLIDALAKRFNMVDINPASRNVPKSTLSYMTTPLAGNTYAWKYKGEPLTAAYRGIVEKARRAAALTGIPEWPDDSSLAYTMKLAGLT